MATAFQSINISLGPRDHKTEATTPTTPRAPLDNHVHYQPPPQSIEESGSTTPTRQSFAESNGKRALPTSPLDATFQPPVRSPKREEKKTLVREDSERSTKSLEDVDMLDSDGEDDGSDGESVDDENGRPSKKKKGQRFFCTDYPPCNLSFTRSEHLARHIRKHTGERPFQCHCARRFSRLDNLRQHAQTVHVNEDIPGDSLAATGTRFQRQIRTDRVRPQSGRSRASTAGSASSHGRGHSRNLSTSSITSTTSTMSTMSNMSSISRENSGRRPPTLMMADHSPRTRLTIDTMKASPQPTYGFANSPSGATTPTSVVYSNGPGSPFGSTLGSPMASQRHSGGYWGDHTPGRRLSVPSGANPFQPSSGAVPTPQYFNPIVPSKASHDSNASSVVTSPTSSIHSFTRQDSMAAAEADLRRRTWHPSTYSNYSYQQRPATSGLIFQQTPDAPRPAFAQQPLAAAASQPQRLPGFETFDQISQQRPPTPPRHPNRQLETSNRPALHSGSSQRSNPGIGHRRGHASWDMSLHQNLTKLDIANGTPPKETSISWAKQMPTTNNQNTAGAPSHILPASVRYSQPPTAPPTGPLPEIPNKRPAETDRSSQARPVTPQRHPKHTMWNGSASGVFRQMRLAPRTSPEDSSSSEGVPTPSTVSVDYQPSIIHANGYIEPQPAATSSFHTFSQASQPSFSQHAGPPSQPQTSKHPDLSGLEALVAVATSEEKSH